MKETLQKSICAQYCVGNIWAIRQTYWVTETTCRIWGGKKKQQPKTHFVFPGYFYRNKNVGCTCLSSILSVTLRMPMMKGGVCNTRAYSNWVGNTWPSKGNLCHLLSREINLLYSLLPWFLSEKPKWTPFHLFSRVDSQAAFSGY